MDWILIIRPLYTMCATISMVGGIILLVRSRGNRARRFHAYSMIFCCVVYFTRYFDILFGGNEPRMIDILNPWALILGIFLVMLLTLYPLEVARPGWLNWGRALRLSAPYLLTVAISLFGMLFIDGFGFLHLDGWGDFRANIATFDVMSRLLLLVCFIGYFCANIWFICHNERLYARWLISSHPGGDEAVRNESWMRCYVYGMILILFGFIYLILFGYHPVAQIYHNVVLQLFLLYTFYKVSYFDSPFMEEFFYGAEAVGPEPVAIGEEDNGATVAVNDQVAVDKWESYKQEVERWFETERPYLNENFRLKSVGERFPLNRSYISRIFNEGYGKSFSIVVRDYRLREAERLLRDEPQATIAQVAERCGFSSSSSFIRAFTGTHDGMTPKQYRDKLVDES